MELAIFRSRVRRPNHYTTEPLKCKIFSENINAITLPPPPHCGVYGGSYATEMVQSEPRSFESLKLLNNTRCCRFEIQLQTSLLLLAYSQKSRHFTPKRANSPLFWFRRTWPAYILHCLPARRRWHNGIMTVDTAK